MKISKNIFGYIALIALLLAAGFFSLNLFFMERSSHDKVNVTKFPHVIDGWKGKDLDMTEREYDILETRNLIFREYINPAKENIYLFVIYSETNRSVFHPPEVCMMGSGVTIVDKQPEKIDLRNGSFFTNKLNVEKKEYKELVLYCYKAGNLYTDNFYLQQIYLALHQLFGRNVPGATVRVSMQLRGDEKETLITLKSFLKQTVEMLDNLAH